MSYRRIVIGVDFATASLAALRWVASSLGRRAQMLLVHVAPDPRRPAFLKQHVPAIDVLHAAPTVYQGLRSLADLAGRDRSDVDILTGDAAEGLVLAAEEFGADLICVGKSRRRRGSGRFGATTPQRVLSRTPLPVLVIPEHARAQPVSVLAALNDGSEGAQVLRLASRLAVEWDARLDALHVLEPELRAIVQDLGAATVDALSDARLCLLAKEWLVEQAAGLEMRKEHFIPIARPGDAGEEIIGHAVRSDTGLIVLGRCSQESTKAAAAPLGSTTRLTMWVAPCPVLVLGAHSAKPEQSVNGGRWRDVVPHREVPALAMTRGAATPLRTSSRRRPDGDDAA